MTTLNEVYTFVPGEQMPWSASTGSVAYLAMDWAAELAAWRSIQAAPNYNPPANLVARDFAPLVQLVAEAHYVAGVWEPDTDAQRAEQHENAVAFGESQLNVILGRDR